MKIQYRNTFHDVAAFNVYATWRTPLMNTVHVLTFLFVAMPLWKFSAGNHSTIARLIACALLGAIVVALFFLLYFVLSMLLLISKKNRTVLTDHTITLGDGSFTTESAYQHTEYKWDAVQQVSQTRRHLYLFISQYGALIIPRRAFPDGSQWERFCELCKRRAGTPAR